jgi:FAD/FMN-containing dehydrogenase
VTPNAKATAGNAADDLIRELVSIVGESGVVNSAALRERACSYWDPSPLTAKALVRPRTTDEVSAVLAACHKVGQPVVTHGGLTGCVEGTVVQPSELVLSLERMTTIEEIDPVGRTATVQAGAVLQTVQEAVAEAKLHFPLDFGARGSCTIGGNVATNAGGINVIRYGMMRELVLGLEAVLADGTVISSMNHMLKNNAGYDLKQLFIGSEGTLGVVTRVVLKLKEANATSNTALIALNDFDSVAQLLKFMERRLGGTLSAYEVMWGDYFRAVTEPGWHRAPMDRDHPFYVIVEANGADEVADAAQFMATLESAAENELIVDAVLPKSDLEHDALWGIREDFEAIIQTKPTFIYDISLPIRSMDEYVSQVQSAVRKRWPHGHFHVLGHIGDGNLHLFVTPGVEGKDLHAQSDDAVYTPLEEIGGSVSAEHGIGLEKKRWLPTSRNAAELELMRALKRMLDSKNLLNPGKVFDA